MKPRTTRQVFSELLEGEHRTLSQVWQEIREAYDAYGAGRRSPEFKIELAQALYEVQMQVFRFTGLDFVLRGCQEAVQGYYNRRVVWAHIFMDAGVPFKGSYLKEGSNYRRPWKVKQALAYAGKEISVKEAIALSEKHSWHRS